MTENEIILTSCNKIKRGKIKLYKSEHEYLVALVDA